MCNNIAQRRYTRYIPLIITEQPATSALCRTTHTLILALALALALPSGLQYARRHPDAYS